MKIVIFILISILVSPILYAQNTEKMYLSGTDKDHTILWDFMVSGGRKSNVWDKIPVPSNWEMQGFGTYNYYSDWAEGHVPDSLGYYKFSFSVPKDWKGRKINIVFEGSMTDTEVKINGILAGSIHQGGFYEFRYDISKLLKYGNDNLLEVKVKRFSANRSINLAERRADFWMFSGIHRPVWLESFPKQHIERFAINAKHNGEISVDVFCENIPDGSVVEARIIDPEGQQVGNSFSIKTTENNEKLVLKSQIQGIKPWTAEWPYLYTLELKLSNQGKEIHRVSDKFGFRTVEVRKNDGIYVNGNKVVLKGSNRHAFWPTSGRTTSKQLSIEDVLLMKDMNMNAVRMSHYPPEKHFLEMTDSLGLYVMDELTGWQNKYDTQVGEKLVSELVNRDVNHPSIILWANGNEGGWNRDLDDDFNLYDPQQRVVIHPWENFNGINTAHYEIYDCCTETFLHGNDLIMPTEFLHGLYDGGNGAGLEDHWNLMLQNPLTAGGFLWAFADEGIIRDDRNGAIDVAGNSAPDGIVGPYREKEASYFTIKEIWSPVFIPLSNKNKFPLSFTGEMEVENRYYHTNLTDVKFSWELINYPKPWADDIGYKSRIQQKIESPDVEPGFKGKLSLGLPDGWRDYDGLRLTATDHNEKNIYTWSWMITEPKETVLGFIIQNDGKSSGVENEDNYTLEASGVVVSINKQNGTLQSVKSNGEQVSLSNGPVMVSGSASLKSSRLFADGNDWVAEFQFDGNLKKIIWRMTPDGWLRLNYAFQFRGHTELEYIGVSFDYPEEKVTGMKWLGKGPYRVWKNRLKGVDFNVWQKDYNDAITGLTWDYPEFKGFHSNVYWSVLQTQEQPITMVFESEDVYLRIFTPSEATEKGFDPRTTHVDFPIGDISFLDGIMPIGTKFHTAEEHGPMGQKNQIPRLGRWFERNVYFFFK
ncbi:MAG: glycoside hydrolase family 2 [Mariniphaga sp.]|nr:glycoside hydrolase family 2 [Mariniphaga sp.]